MLEVILSLDIIVQICLVVHVISVLFSFGVAMAYLSRYKIRTYWTKKDIADIYFVSFCISLFGLLAAPSLFVTPSVGEYGWKVWHGERRNSSNKWFIKKQEVMETVNYRFRPRKIKSGPGGACYSIWE